MDVLVRRYIKVNEDQITCNDDTQDAAKKKVKGEKNIKPHTKDANKENIDNSKGSNQSITPFETKYIMAHGLLDDSNENDISKSYLQDS